ncbi:MAG TPA: prepilin-type N-terminal cleavage/methylation domain-containing protein [Candidatus Angelobacter sp.]|nr:prepilin-type N-terminal cleavage/methylation domain-containing protein [Candidatus Angelobacter sp.]
MRRQPKTQLHNQRGFTLIEMAVATAVLLIGIVGVAKLVPVAVNMNMGNRSDSTSLVIAQREMDALLGQPISANPATFTDPQGLVCPAAGVCNLGNVATPGVIVGSPLLNLGNRPLINYGVAQVAGYSFNYSDPNDPTDTQYDIRWAVITLGNGTTASAKRFIVGVRRSGGNFAFLPITLDAAVDK